MQTPMSAAAFFLALLLVTVVAALIGDLVGQTAARLEPERNEVWVQFPGGDGASNHEHHQAEEYGMN